MNPTETTAAQERLKITVLDLEERRFQCIRDLQLRSSAQDFGNEFRRDPQSNRLSGDFIELDLAANAESLGARVWRVSTAGELEAALAEGRAETRPAPSSSPPTATGGALRRSGDVAPAEVSLDEMTIQARDEYELGRTARYYG
jgi:3D-(3,5/4)-trihydroxycyclohexane-1,2-dione acylhydrolase (decyclizing)